MSIQFGGGGTQTRQTAVPQTPAMGATAGQAQGALIQAQSQQDQQNALNQQLYGGTQQAAAGNLNAQIQAGGLGTASPAQLQQIQTMFANPTQQAQTALQLAATNAAASRGMSISDSPIGSEYLRQQQLLLGNIAGQQANAGLQYGQQALQNNQQQANFGQNLAQAAQQNRMQLAQGAGNLNANLFGQAQAAAPTRGSLTQNPTYGGNVGQLGGLAMGGAQAYNAYQNAGNQNVARQNSMLPMDQRPSSGAAYGSSMPMSWFNS